MELKGNRRTTKNVAMLPKELRELRDVAKTHRAKPSLLRLMSFLTIQGDIDRSKASSFLDQELNQSGKFNFAENPWILKAYTSSAAAARSAGEKLPK